jgi:hypothetical protein
MGFFFGEMEIRQQRAGPKDTQPWDWLAWGDRESEDPD